MLFELIIPLGPVLVVGLPERVVGWMRGMAGIRVLKLPCPSHPGLTMTLESVPPLIGNCGITNVGNALHSGALSLDDNPCFDDFLTFIAPVACTSILECDGSLAGDFTDDVTAFRDLVDFFLSPFLFFLGMIFLSASSCW